MLPAGDATARFDLHISLTESSTRPDGQAGLRGSVMVAADLFDPASRLGRSPAGSARVLAAVAADPQLAAATRWTS